MKKKIALYLALVLLFTSFPAPAYGGPSGPGKRQAPVADLKIQNDPQNTSATNYSVILEWSQPFNATVDTSSVSGTDNATAFDLYYRNATSNEPEGAAKANVNASQRDPIEGDPPGTKYTQTFSNLALDQNSLYEFYAKPVHINNYPDIATIGGELPLPAPADTNAAPEQRGLYLTNMSVTADGSGNELTVSWVNPTVNGTDVFTGYEIYYKEYDAINAAINTVPITVAIDDPNIKKGANGAFSYTIVDNSLRPGQQYSVKIEPRIGNASVRKDFVTTVAVDGEIYSLAYKPFIAVEYRYDNAYVSPGLSVSYEGQDYVRLTWGLLSDLPTGQRPVRLEIFMSENADMSGARDPIVTIEGDDLLQISSYLTEHEDKPWYFQIHITYSSGGADLVMESEIMHAVPSYSDFDPYKPDLQGPVSVTAQTNNAVLGIRWLAFLRSAYLQETTIPEEEAAYGPGMIVDRLVEYDIYITDDFDNFSDPNILAYPVINRYPGTSPYTAYPEGNTQLKKLPTYLTTAGNYYALDDATGDYVSQTIGGNKVYYIMIIARRLPDGQESTPAYGSVFVPPLEDLVLNPQLMDAPPLEVVEEDTTAQSITVEWPVRFLEIYNPGADQWYSVIGVDSREGRNRLVYGKSAQAIESMTDGDANNVFEISGTVSLSNLMSIDMTTAGAISSTTDWLLSARTQTGSWIDDKNAARPSPLSVRMIDLKNALYEMHVVKYDDMMAAGGYEAYLAGISGWTPVPNVTGTGVEGMVECVVSGLENNTTYVIYVRPYEASAQGLRSYYPAYVIETTGDVKPPLLVEPNTPVLFPDDEKTTYDSLTVYWQNMGVDDKLDPRFEYDLYYTDDLQSYESKTGTLIPWATVKPGITIGKGKGERANDGKEYLYYTITGLFPDTTYYIWAVARVVGTAGTSASGYSNPVDMRTDDIEAPSPPILGTASAYLLNRYNSQTGSAYTQFEPNALNVTVSRNSNDEGALETSGTSSTVGDITGTGSLLPLDIAENFYIVRFDGLDANREYFVRAKTVFTVFRSGSGAPTEEKYSYVIQVSLDEDFESYIQFAIPSYTPVEDLDEANNKQKESEWVDIDLNTAMSDDEFGGNVDPRMYPLPDQDWDITYDEDQQKLKFRFRTNQVGADGAADQHADQRFISRLVEGGLFNYTVSLANYQNEPIKVRELELPYTIMQAFDERQITLHIQAGDYNLSVPPGSFNTAQTRSLQMGAGSNIIMSMSGEPAGLPSLNANETFSVQPQRLSATAATTAAPARTVALESFAKPITVSLPSSGLTDPEGMNTGLYYASPNTGGWQDMPGQYSYTGNALSGSTSRPGSFAGITRLTPEPVMPATQDASYDAMQRVTGRMSVTDMAQYNALETVSSSRFNNFVAAAAMERQTVAMNGSLSPADQEALAKAGLLTGGTLTREAAMNAMVRLYELKTKRALNPMTTAETLPGIEYASPQYRTNLLKAADLGFVSGDLNPANPLTMGDLMIMLDIVLQDAR